MDVRVLMSLNRCIDGERRMQKLVASGARSVIRCDWQLSDSYPDSAAHDVPSLLPNGTGPC